MRMAVQERSVMIVALLLRAVAVLTSCCTCSSKEYSGVMSC
jgi:hypothetical protein